MERRDGIVMQNGVPAFEWKKSTYPSKIQQNINQHGRYKGLYRWVERCEGAYCTLLTRTILTLTARLRVHLRDNFARKSCNSHHRPKFLSVQPTLPTCHHKAGVPLATDPKPKSIHTYKRTEQSGKYVSSHAQDTIAL